MASLNTMVRKVAGLADTTDVSQRENEFIKNIVRQTSNGDNTTSLTEKQVAWLDDLHSKHFAD